MATTLGQLRQSAKALGISAPAIRGLGSEELSALIAEHLNGGGTKAPARKTRTAPARKTATKTAARKPAARKPAASAKSKPAAKSTTGKAKRSTSGTGNGNGSGRHLLVDVDYNQTDGWNAREGSAPDLIVKSLRRFKGNRAKVFDALVPKIGTFVNPKDSQGRKRSKDNAEEMLRYRISRTAWDFAMKTGQHEKSTDRIEYGSNAGTKKPARKATGGSRTAAKAKATPRATRKPATRQTAARKPAARKTVAKKSPVAKKKTTARR
jgi:hypothetical protein